MRRRILVVSITLFTLVANASQAVSPDAKCEATKLKTAGQYGFCRLKAEAKAVKTGAAADYSKCDEKYAEKWDLAESAAGAGVCPSEGDKVDLHTFIAQHTDDVSTALAGGGLPAGDTCGNAVIDADEDCDQGNLNGASCATQGFIGGTLACGADCVFDTSGCQVTRFVDNGDGTVTDYKTGLVWEQKTDDNSVHDVDNIYTWGTNTAPDGTAFTAFLATLNGATSPNGDVVTGCFAGRCDWRLPTVVELSDLVDCGSGSPCLPPIFGSLPSPPLYFSSVTSAASQYDSWRLEYSDGTKGALSKSIPGYARAVSGLFH